jgi:flagellar motor switch protein FliM
MGKFDALLEDEDDIFGGTPVSKYWDIFRQISEDLQEHEFDGIIERIAVMEHMLSESHDYEELDKIIKRHAFANQGHIDELKKSLYMELAGQLIFRMAD